MFRSNINKNGELSSLEGFITEVSRNKQNYRTSGFNEERWRNIFENNPQGIAIGNCYGFFIQVNRAWKKMFGFSDADVISLHMKDIRTEEDYTKDRELFTSLLKGEIEQYRIERAFLKKDRSAIWGDLTVRIIKDCATGELFVIGLYVDIGERKKVEEALKLSEERNLLILEKSHVDLEKRVAERTGEIRRLNLRVIQSQEKERQRVARDLHDGVGQTILAAKFALENFIKGQMRDKNLLMNSLSFIDRVSRELREIYTGLYPSMLTDLGLDSTIRWCIKNYLGASGIGAEYINTLSRKLSPDAEVNIYRIMQELFNNIVKHSGADKVQLLIFEEEENVVIDLADNGRGFYAENLNADSCGTGIINIRQRVEYLGGKIILNPQRSGTHVRIELNRNSVCL